MHGNQAGSDGEAPPARFKCGLKRIQYGGRGGDRRRWSCRAGPLAFARGRFCVCGEKAVEGNRAATGESERKRAGDWRAWEGRSD
jgi:hypothetical protein